MILLFYCISYLVLKLLLDINLWLRFSKKVIKIFLLKLFIFKKYLEIIIKNTENSKYYYIIFGLYYIIFGLYQFWIITLELLKL